MSNDQKPKAPPSRKEIIARVEALTKEIEKIYGLLHKDEKLLEAVGDIAEENQYLKSRLTDLHNALFGLETRAMQPATIEMVQLKERILRKDFAPVREFNEERKTRESEEQQ